MGRPSKLTPQQWTEVERRLLAGETARGIAPDFGISEAGIRKRFGAHQSISAQSAQVRTVAEKLADASLALQALPPAQRSVAVDLAEELRTMSVSVARAANLGAKTGHRLHALANSEVAKVDDAAPLSEESIAALKGVGVLTKLANDSLSPALNLLAANKDRVKEITTPPPEDDPGPPLRPQISREQWLKEHGLG
jgi:hypothetical protein